MTEFRELLRVTFPTDDGPYDHLSSHPAQIADHIRQLNVHLRQCFLHSLNAGRRPNHVLCPLPPVGAQDPNL